METINKNFQLSEYNFELPLERIAPFPERERKMSKLLLLDRKSGKIEDSVFENIQEYLKNGDLLVFNDSKVIKARLMGNRTTGGEVELFLLKPALVSDEKYEIDIKNWDALINPARSLKAGQAINLKDCKVKILEKKDNGVFAIEICPDDTSLSMIDYIDKYGEVPIPPYIARRRHLEDCADRRFDDDSRYQTVYAAKNGSVAAPTAGFHFENGCFQKLKEIGIKISFVTLHVGLGTFKPVKSADVRGHNMDPEWFSIPDETIPEILSAKKEGRRVIAVGTTSVRVLESAFRTEKPKKSGWTDLFIYPGFEFKAVDAMITNFHLPESTLLLLVSALAGRENIFKAYDHAIKNGYRFFSYGDAMFIV